MKHVCLFAMLAACAPTDPTQLVVVVDSDLPSTQLDTVEVVVRGLAGGEQTARARLVDGPLPRVVAIERRGGPVGPIEIEARALVAGVPQVSQRRRTSFVAQQTRRVDLFLTSACVDLDCGTDTCERGDCRSVDVPPESLAPWEGIDGGVGPDAGADAQVPDDASVDAFVDADAVDANTSTCEAPSVPGLVLHLDARDVRGAVWPDRSGFGRDATLTAATWVPDAFGLGLPAVATRSDVKSFVSFENPVLGTTEVSFFLVLRTDDDRSTGNARNRSCVLGSFVAGGAAPSMALVANGGTLGLSVAEGNTYTPAVIASGSIADARPHVITGGRRENGASTQGGLWVDSVLVGAGPLNAGAIGVPARWRLGSHDDEERGRFAAQYAEVRVYDRALTPVEVVQVEEYLRCTWVP
ncbi:MAG: hypothetical protein H6721_23020 [Sandaracinus sp.]|nr:hypothetical protein [Sandaracinus sp.]MCB9635007.1 hypothetical protein [Sandaracinus sp.]